MCYAFDLYKQPTILLYSNMISLNKLFYYFASLEKVHPTKSISNFKFLEKMLPEFNLETNIDTIHKICPVFSQNKKKVSGLFEVQVSTRASVFLFI